MTDAGATLVGQLRRAGSLSAQQVDFLRQRGFLPPAAEDRAAEDGEDGWDDGHDFVPDSEDETEQLASARRRGGGRRPRGPDLKAEMLAGQLEALYAQRLGVLEAALPLAEGERSIAAAMRRLRRRTAQDLAGPLRDLLAGGTLSVERLWGLLALDDFDRVGRDAPGPAPQSYRALVTAARTGQADPPQKYAWLLREPAVASVYDLLVSQRRMIEAAGVIHRSDPAVLREGLRRRPHPLAFWVLALLYNADLEAGRLGKQSGTRQAVPGRPGEQTWARAWGQALLMDERGVLPLLASLHGRARTPEGEPVEVPLYVPAAWAKLAYRYGA